MRRRLGPQVLQLLRRGGTTEYLVAVRVAPKALYDATGSLGLRDPKLGHRPQVGLGVGCFLLSVLNATLVESEILECLDASYLHAYLLVLLTNDGTREVCFKQPATR